MTHIKYPNHLGDPMPSYSNWKTPVPHDTNWQAEAMRQNRLLHDAMLRAAKAEAKLAKAYDIIARIVAIAPDGDEYDDEWHMTYDAAKNLLAELEKTE